MKNRLLLLLLGFFISFALVACSPQYSTCVYNTTSSLETISDPNVTTLTTYEANRKLTTTITSASTTPIVTIIKSTTEIGTTTTTQIVEADATKFSLSEIPEFSGNPYIEINNNIPYFTEYPTTSFELYSPLDNLGRCGVAYANIGQELMPTNNRSEIGSIKPSGWHTANYIGIIEDIYLYNRCHLIGYQLAGENANERNLITGTRYMNIEGMQPFENMVANYVLSYNNHVLYRVTPIFDGDNLVANGVLMEAYSLEDNGAGIQFCVFCYNVQPNIGINYADGESWSLIEEPTEPQQVVIERGIPPIDDSNSYVLNTNTHKFHSPSCSSVNSMKDKNKDYYTGSRDDVIAMGYDPCKRCNP